MENRPQFLREQVPESGEHATITHDMKQRNQDFKLQLSALKEAPQGLTYLSRMLRLLSLSTEGINPHEGERHIQALVTGWHLAEDGTPRPCPPHYKCHSANVFLILYDRCIKQRQSKRQVCKSSRLVITQFSLNENAQQQHLNSPLNRYKSERFGSLNERYIFNFKDELTFPRI